ncbi:MULTISPECIES: EamA family transporter [Paraburkholderia]|jgi:O-acetylserine/cysteine efflux transporter|uniref:O-acetylserine/cysteine efflux transporter n=1 Tax=Paraburkholderia tropica TaxID=92647 RepID=A0A1A5XNL6_9BURK|nr:MULTISPECIES: EamA family transporter [Paraburkholderia]MBB2977350.1 O-acetylserine/cysteine efflux transporter [Paraburkholderia tropica]MBB2997789.1 O-acetylserine/cysteine efflux transporter [Paraburkholderia tropica]MBB6316811.1 O-acetylserine/cysteine efflux transporter [Paraburkholderia tropica]MBN3810216.1 EamA family transporter [Paraburkholderia sp. Ac-20347]MDE1141995.1 EamA family transporter [Paraburkholderia tropica]
MSPKDLLLALVVVIAWGVNFVVIKVGLHGVPPLLLGALRFMLAAFPAVLFVKRPKLPLRWLLAYGATISFGQFAFLFTAMYVGMPAGLASVVLQAQAFFTLVFAAVFLGERFRAQNVIGLLIAAGGLALIGLQSTAAAGVGVQTMTAAGFILTLCAACMWALGNIVTKKVGKVDLVGLVVWASLIPPLPFLVLSYFMEGPQRIETALEGIGMTSIGAIVYLAFIATILGYSLWSRLLAKYPASQVAPFSLLVPIVGLAAAALLLGERLSAAQIGGAALVMAGLGVNVFGGWVRQRLVAART